MKLLFSVSTAIFIFSSCQSTTKNRGPQSEDLFSTKSAYYEPAHLHLRLSQYLEAPDQKFNGCVLYLEGLGDSVVNHAPLFSHLSQRGFRVISFDYMGQGGSEGYMNNTRVHDIMAPHWNISNQAKWVWNYFSENSDSVYERNCARSKRYVVGWSTGGLAAYKMAEDHEADAVALLAPGISPKIFVGTSAGKKSNIIFQDVISLPTLTRVNYTSDMYNPHVDEISPASPMQVPSFATNLLLTAGLSEYWNIDSSVRGLVLLSGVEDTYVDQLKTKAILQKHAPHFKVKAYPGALHELDNEWPDVANDVHEQVTQFFLNQ